MNYLLYPMLFKLILSRLGFVVIHIKTPCIFKLFGINIILKSYIIKPYEIYIRRQSFKTTEHYTYENLNNILKCQIDSIVSLLFILSLHRFEIFINFKLYHLREILRTLFITLTFFTNWWNVSNNLLDDNNELQIEMFKLSLNLFLQVLHTVHKNWRGLYALILKTV